MQRGTSENTGRCSWNKHSYWLERRGEERDPGKSEDKDDESGFCLEKKKWSCCVHLKLAQWLKLIASSALGCLNTLKISFSVSVTHLKQFWPKEKRRFEVTRWQYSTADDYLGSLGRCGLAGAMQSSGSKSNMFLWIVTCPPHIDDIHVSTHTLWGCISLHQWAHYTVTNTHTHAHRILNVCLINNVTTQFQ